MLLDGSIELSVYVDRNQRWLICNKKKRWMKKKKSFQMMMRKVKLAWKYLDVSILSFRSTWEMVNNGKKTLRNILQAWWNARIINRVKLKQWLRARVAKLKASDVVQMEKNCVNLSSLFSECVHRQKIIS